MGSLHQKLRPGDTVTFKATVIQLSTDDELWIETKNGRSKIDLSMVVNSERQCVKVDELVESKLPNRGGIIGIVRFIDGDDVTVRWPVDGRPNGKSTIEDLNSLRVVHVKPM